MVSSLHKSSSIVYTLLVLLVGCSSVKANARSEDKAKVGNTLPRYSCLDEEGNPVEFWIAYQMPNDGSYFYMTDKDR